MIKIKHFFGGYKSEIDEISTIIKSSKKKLLIFIGNSYYVLYSQKYNLYSICRELYMHEILPLGKPPLNTEYDVVTMYKFKSDYNDKTEICQVDCNINSIRIKQNIDKYNMHII